ncbi:MAG: GldG family protein [Kiritimatiellae bacterium]|nr:GldG family protein [Kiritimatiellia bacterium]
MHTDDEADRPTRLERRRRMGAALNFWVGFLLIGALLIMLNYLASRHYLRADWSRPRRAALSAKTRKLLRALDADLHVLVFYRPNHPAYPHVRNLLKEYMHLCPRLRVEYVDPDRDLSRVKELALAYGLTGANVVVFECDERRKIVAAEDILEIAEVDAAPALGRAAGRRYTFRGEQAFSSAVLSVMQGTRRVVCFLDGHGEKDVDSYDQYAGYSRIAKIMRDDHIETRKIVLERQPYIPADASAVVIAGPKKPFSREELEIVRRYLDGNGKIMFLLDLGFRSGLETLLADWGVRVTHERVVEPARIPALSPAHRGVAVTQYGRHPVTDGLGDMVVKFYVPCVVEPVAAAPAAADQADKPSVAVLAQSSPDAWAEADLLQEPARFDAGYDRKGPLPIALAVEKGPIPGIAVEIRPTRIVVIGDSEMISNNALSGANVDFFMNALNWLVERETLIAVTPKSWEEYRLEMNRNALYALFGLLVLAFPAAAATVSLLLWLRRRN